MTVKMDASQVLTAYSKAFRLLRQMPGFEPRAVLRAEAGSILKRWAGLVKVATPDQTEWRARYRAGKRAFGDVGSVERNPYGISVNTGLRGGIKGLVWFRTAAKKWQDVGVIRDTGQIGTLKNRHYAAADWSKIVSGMEAYGDSLALLLPHAAKSVGMNRQAVVQIADDLGIDLAAVKGAGASATAIAKARAAVASTGRSYKNGFGTQGGSGWLHAWVKLESRMPKGVKSGMDRSLLSALSGRQKFITNAYKKGAFNSIERAARAFPNVFREINLSSD